MGASGTIGTVRALAGSSGWETIHIGLWGSEVIAGAIYPLADDPIRDIEPISLVRSLPVVLFARKDLPAADVKELINLVENLFWARRLRERPPRTCRPWAHFSSKTRARVSVRSLSRRSASTTGLGSRSHRPPLGLILNSSRRFELAISRLFGAEKRVPCYRPKHSNSQRDGLDALSFTGWSALFAPKGTPRDIIEKLKNAASQALDDPTVAKRFAYVALTVVST